MTGKITKVFVYGTLKAGRPLDRQVFADRRTLVQQATIKGGIYNLGRFPTIKLADKGIVHGEVHTFKDEDFDDILQTMDYVEGYNSEVPEQGLYNRSIIDVVLEDGTTTQAWAYEYNGNVKEEQKIKSGVWEPA